MDRERGDLLAKLDVARKTFIASQGPEQILQQKNVKQLSRDHQEEQQKQEPQESGVICQEVSQPTSQKPQQQQIQVIKIYFLLRLFHYYILTNILPTLQMSSLDFRFEKRSKISFRALLKTFNECYFVVF